MKKVYLHAQVDEEKCVGDKLCEFVCPSGAIEVSKKKAHVDNTHCVACSRCVDVCNEKAIQMVPLPEPRVLGVNPAEVDQVRLQELCRRANMDPDEPICLCTFTTAREAAAAILKGAASPEEVTRMTGARSACALWCMAPMLRLLNASGVEMKPSLKPKWYNVEAALWNVPDEVAEKYPQYRLKEDKTTFSEQNLMDSMIYKFK
jgi:Pyruvate/2-oxoacid:ferredoxin oxidoreductase delta subunit/bacterioferritin-associated ferredoxin